MALCSCGSYYYILINKSAVLLLANVALLLQLSAEHEERLVWRVRPTAAGAATFANTALLLI